MKKRPKLKLERWTSTMNHEERHYFIEGKGRGYQHNKYVFGFNPELVRMRKIADDLYEFELI